MNIPSNYQVEELLAKVKLLEDELTTIRTEFDYEKNHDNLTRFLNFTAFKNIVREKIKQNPNERFVIILISINNTKFINRILNNEYFDVLLKSIATRLTLPFKEGVCCARRTNEEFILILPELSRTLFAAKIKKIIHALSQPILINQQSITISASMGCCFYPQDATKFGDLLENCVIALEKAKTKGSNSMQRYSTKIGEGARYFSGLQRDLMVALAKRELYIEYQPQVSLNSKEIVGAEAVLRWNHPLLGCIYPDEFIPILEQMDLISAVGEWLLEQACQQAIEWHTLHPNLKIAINVSLIQLRHHKINDIANIAAQVKRVLASTHFPPALLELEITESNIYNNDSATKNTLKRLKKLGVNIACDDFGTGYSSFSRLKQLPLNTIKIDRSLIKGITQNTVDLTIVKSILEIAEVMRIGVVAEGISSKKELEILQELGCDLIQGYYFSKALSGDAFTALLKNPKAILKKIKK